MNEKILSSQEIVERAIAEYKPYAIVLMFSGGDDSLTALNIAKYLNVPFTHIMHGVTGTGIIETYDFVKSVVNNEAAKYIEANAGDSYINYVLRKGFFGKGLSAHAFSYHILKQDHFESAISKHIRQRVAGRKILFINGARRLESDNRKKTMVNPIKITNRRPNDIWVNIINEWTKPECLSFLNGEGIKRNPVSIQICRSGECMCGTMQSKADRIEASCIFPKWGKWLDELEKVVKEKHAFGWGENKPKQKDFRQLDLFQPMCVGCNRDYQEAS